MRWMVVVALTLVVASGCAYSAPTTPTTPPSSNPNEPFSITLGSNVGSGATADHATITAKVQGPTGVPLAGVTVTFSTTAGALDPESVATAGNGIGTTTLVASTAAMVTAKAGQVSARADVGTQQAASLPTTPTPTPTPPPPSGGAPTPIPTNLVLNLPSTGTTNVSVAMFVSGPSTAAPFAWTFGDGSTTQTAAFNTTHTYTAAGTYTVGVSGTSGSTNGKITISDPPAPPPPSPPGAPAYTVTLTATPSTVVVNTTGVMLSANVNQQFGAPPATSFTWDCGDGVPVAGPNPHNCPLYPTAGTFTAKVTATGGSVSGSGTTTITVTPPPVPGITVNCAQPTPPALTLNCAVSATLNGSPVPSTAITHVDWDWGNTETSSTATNSTTHNYIATGANTYIIIASNVAVTGTTATGTGSTSKQVQ